MKTAAKAASDLRDYLVVCDMGYGGGSWARDKDLETAVKACRRIVYSDWKGLFKLDGVEVTLSLFDVTGQDEVNIGGGEVRGDHPEIPIQNLGPRLVRLPVGRR
jgi:hypothetical protein